ncbi:MAG: helix-turn-helix transcriptional regulator [Chloroflexi bacterium]|nr:helix-turn-helix transcriptional regulator [Chloroflexota bacterium]OJV89774.1 MAG: hypothetical protein BGO39_28950 [Chloroflexi bacterium 54-19]
MAKFRKNAKDLNILKKTRLKAGLTATELAEKSKIGIATISRIENNAKGRANTLKKLADTLGVDVELFSDLLDHTNIENKLKATRKGKIKDTEIIGDSVETGEENTQTESSEPNNVITIIAA